MDDATSDAVSMNRRILLDQLMTIRSLMHKGGADDDMKKGMTLNREQLTGLSAEFLLTALLDLFLLRLLDEGEEGGASVPPMVSSAQQFIDDAAAAKKKKRKKEAAAKKKRNKAAAKHKKTKLMSWLGGGIISVIMMIASFSFISTPIVTLSLFQPSDGSGEGKAPPALPPSASKIIHQGDLKPNVEASTSPDIIRSPLAAVVPPPIFAPTAISNRRMKSDEMRASTCLDTPNWKDQHDYGCHVYERGNFAICSVADKYAGDLGPATKHCCVCGGGSHSLPPTNSPTITNSPTKSAAPSSSPSSKPTSFPSISANPSTAPSSTPSTAPFCTDSEGWRDYEGYDCSWYEAMDLPGCPEYGDLYKDDWWMGTASANCCHCKDSIVHTASPSNTPSSSSSPTSAACVDTLGWQDDAGRRCNNYYENYDPGCPDTDEYAGDIGPATNNCCYCKNPSCGDYKSKCQDIAVELGVVAGTLCKQAESCSCEATAANHDVKIVTNVKWKSKETVGLYDECKCDFWLRLCEDTRVGEACDYAAEYCCGDYKYGDGMSMSRNVFWGFSYLNSPTCYCDFFNYAQKEFGHKLKSKALNTNKEFENPCGQLQTFVAEVRIRRDFERPSLEAIYKGTNGQKWKNNVGWMNVTVDYCEWHGITCDGNGFVTSIDLRDNNLSGRFPVYSRDYRYHYGLLALESHWLGTKYGLSNLYNLETLDLAENKLTGKIDYRTLYNLKSLSHFDVSVNQLSGGMDALVTPSLTYVDFSKNNFTSMRRFGKVKQSSQTLRFCDLSMNAIQNDATDLLENIPPNIERFFASNNRIDGSLPESLNYLPKLGQFDMSSNALSGSLPGFADSILSLQELDFSYQTNGCTGSIPKDLWRFQSLKILSLAGNKLAGPIPPDIGKMTALEEFDLSNNFLSGRIPSQMGLLEGSLQFLGLANNTLSGFIPSQLGQLQGASVIVEGNSFDDNSTAPLSLCTLRSVIEFDLATDTELCPVERKALSDFYYSTKGTEWTDSVNWLDEFSSYCDWKGVTCDEDKKHVIKLKLANNGLSGRLNESIGDLTFIEELDLSDNDIKGSIPTEVGLLSELSYLRLSYNSFTGTAPRVLGALTKLQLLQLQSNRITEMPNMTQLDESKYNISTFVTDCGVPSAFDEAPKCENCTMCCNANDDCYPHEDTPVTEHLGLNYATFAAVFFASFIVFCCLVSFFFYLLGKLKNNENVLTMSAERRLEEDDKYALSRIGKDSVYSYFVTDKVPGWLAAFATLGIQIAILVFFIMASEANLQDDKIDIQFTWKCPRDSDVCKDKADLTGAGWFIFSVLMIAFLAKDMVNGCKLIYHSSKLRHTLISRIRYFIGGMGLCSITVFALYVSTVYNKAIATSNTEIIVNSVIVLFIMEIDEYIFSAVDAINEKWTEHAADTKVSEMEKEIARQRAQIESQQEAIDNQRKDIGMLREAVDKIRESQAAASTASDSESAECERNTDAQQVEEVDQIAMPSEAEEQDIQE